MTSYNRAMRVIAVLIALVLAVPNSFYAANAAEAGEVRLALSTVEILDAVARGTGATGSYRVDSVPAVTVVDEDGTVLDHYEAPLEGLHASYQLEREIGAFLDALELPYEQARSVLVRSELMEALEGTWPVKAFAGQGAIAVIDPGSYELVLLAVNTGPTSKPFALTISDPEGRALDLTQTAALIRKAALLELSDEELARHRGGVELLEITTTVSALPAAETEQPEEEPPPAPTVDEDADGGEDHVGPDGESPHEDEEEPEPEESAGDTAAEDDASEDAADAAHSEAGETADLPRGEADGAERGDSGLPHRALFRAGTLRIGGRPTALAADEAVAEAGTETHDDPEWESPAPPAAATEAQVVAKRYTAVVTAEESGGARVDGGTVTVRVPGYGWAAVTVRVAALDTPEEVVVTFDPLNGEDPFTRAVGADGTVSEPPNPTVPAGLTYFTGWYLRGAGPQASPFDFATVLTADLSLEARYSDHYTVLFKNAPGEDGRVIHTQQVPQGHKATAYQPLPHELAGPSGAQFSYWYEEGKTPDRAFDFGAVVSENVVLVAKYSEHYAVMFLSEGTQVDPLHVAMGQPVPPDAWPGNPTRTGYTFKHWSTAPQGDEYNRARLVDGDLILYAVWEAQEVAYTVVHWVEKPDISGDPGTASHNYTFKSSTTHRAPAGTPVSELPPELVSIPYAYFSQRVTSNADTVLGNGTTVVNLYYRLTEYTFTFNLNPGEGSGMTRTATMHFHSDPDTEYRHRGNTVTRQYSFTAKVGQSIAHLWPSTANATFSRTGSLVSNTNFGGWSTTASILTGRTYLVTHRETLTADLLPTGGTVRTYYAHWISSAKDSEVNYYFEQLMHESGGVPFQGRHYVLSDVYSHSYESDGTALSPKVIEGMGVVNGAAQSGNPKSFYYTRSRDNLTFNPQGGSFAHSLPPVGAYSASGNIYGGVMYGEQLSAFRPQDPTREENGIEYRFDGWYYDAEYRNPVAFDVDTMPHDPLTLYAKWTSTEHAALFYSSARGGEPVATTYIVDGFVEQPDIYAVGQYVEGMGEFLGWQWYIGPRLFDFSFDTIVRGDVELYAKWRTEGFTVTYLPGAGAGSVPVDGNTYHSGVMATVLAPESLTPPGSQVFVGWRREGDSRTYYPGGSVQVTGDVELTAWFVDRSRTVTLTYHPNGGTGAVEPMLLEEGARVTLRGADAFAREGYTLDGWARTAGENSPKVYEPEQTITVLENLELHAVWKQSAYTVRFAAGNGGSLEGAVSCSVPHGTPWRDGVAVPEARADAGHYFSHWEPALPQGEEFVMSDAVYTAVFAPQTALTITADNAAKTYDGEPLVAAGYTVSPDTLAVTVTGVSVRGSITDAGTAPAVVDATRLCVRNAAGADVTAQYAVNTVDGTLRVNTRSLIVAADSANRSYTGSAQRVDTYTVDGDGLVRDHTVKAGVTVLGQGTAPGRYPVAATVDRGTLRIEDGHGGDATGNYRVSTRDGELVIDAPGEPWSWTVTAPGATRTYNGATQSFAGSLRHNLPDGFRIEGYSVKPATGKDVGAYEQELVTASGARIFNERGEDVTAVYGAPTVELGRLEIVRKTLTLTVDSKAIVYGDPAPALTASYSGFVGGDDESVLSQAPVFTTDYSPGDDCGSYRITATGSASGNYDIRCEPGTLTVSARTLTVIADSGAVVYDGTLHEVSSFQQPTGLLSGHRVAEGVRAYGNGRYPDSYLVAVIVDNPVILDTQGGNVTANYTLRTVAGTLTVSAPDAGERLAWSATAHSATHTYNAAPWQTSGFATDLPDGYTVQGLTASASATNAGTYPVTFHGTPLIRDEEGMDVTPYYADPVLTEGELVIDKASLTIHADDKTVVFGAPAPAYTARCVGFQGDDDESSLTTPLRFVCDYGPGGASGVYAITPEGASSPNYEISYEPGTLSVLDDTSTMTAGASDVTVTYDGNAHAIDVVVGGVTGARIEYRLPGGTWSDDHPQLVAVADSAPVEYRVSKAGYAPVTGSARVTIQPRDITVQADSVRRTYTGRSIAVDTGAKLVAGSLVQGQTLRAAAAGSGLSVGSYPIAVTDAAIEAASGDVSANYAITLMDGALTIERGSPGGGSGNRGNSGGGGTRTPSGYGETATIADAAVPLADLPDGAAIEDAPVPLSALPAAGGLPVELFFVLGLCMLGGGAVLKIRGRRGCPAERDRTKN